MESSQSCAATLTHYSTEPLTTGPDYDPLLLLLAPALAGDVHPNPGPPKYPCSRTSLAKVPATCVQDARIGYIQDVLVFETLRIIIEPMAGSVPPVGRNHRLVPPTHIRQDAQHTTVERQWPRQQTDGTKHLPGGAQRQSGGHSGVQAHGKIEKSQHPELYPLVRQDLRLGPGGGLLFLSITQSASLASHCQQRRRMTPT